MQKTEAMVLNAPLSYSVIQVISLRFVLLVKEI